MSECYSFVVNGVPCSTEEEKPLLRYLRDELRLTSVKDGCSEGACGPLGGQDAGLDGLAVHQDGAGAAGALAAPVLYTGEMQGIPQVAEQLLVVFHCHGPAVHGKFCHGKFLLDCRAQPWSHGHRCSFGKVDLSAVSIIQ